MDSPDRGTTNSGDPGTCEVSGAPLEGGSGEIRPGRSAGVRNMGGVLSYLFGWVTGLLFVAVERQDGFVRFHALQSIAAFGGLTIAIGLLIVLTNVPYVGAVFGIVGTFALFVGLVLWVFLMYKAYQGERYKLPVAGDWADKHA